MAAATTFSGLASGIDSAALIKSMVSVAKQPITRLETKKTTNNAVSKKLTDIKSKLTALQTAAKTLDTRKETLVNKATSSDDKVLTVSTTGGASLGSFSLTVDKMAKAERTYSNGFASSSQPGLFPDDDFTIQVGSGTPASISVVASDTLESIAGKINAANVGVTAGLVYDGKDYKLQVNSNTTGTDSAITFGGVGATNLGLDDPANEFQSAQNARVLLDNLVIESQKNSITSAIPGVTLNVVKEGTVDVNIDRDPEGLKTKVDAFVKAYNDVMTTMNAEFAYTGTQKSNSLSGDSTLRSVQTDMRAIVSQDFSGLSSSFGALGAIGIAVGRDGTLSVDQDKLTKAVNSDYEGVGSILAGNGVDKGLTTQLIDKIEPYVQADGAISSRIKNLSQRNRDVDTQVARMQTRIDKYEESLTRQYASLEKLVSGLNSQGSALSAMLSS